MKRKHIGMLLFLAAIHYGTSASAQGTAFTYQGRLNDGASAAGGSYDLRFSIYDSLSGGTPQGNSLTNAATAISNGFFTVTLDFGNKFPGADRWLEIAVRTNGAASFFTLSPRQALTPAPYAITAGSVISGGLAAGTYGNAVTLNNAANQIGGSFTGNGANVTNVNAATVGGITSAGFWQTQGNVGANPANGAFIGTADNLPLEFKVNTNRALRLEYATGNRGVSPNVIGGYAGNVVSNGFFGAFIGGGGNAIALNRVGNSFASVLGGFDNLAAGYGATAIGLDNKASGFGSTAMGNYTIASGFGSIAMGYSTTASGDNSTAMGDSTTASGMLSTVMGQDSTAGGIDSTAMGESTTASGNYSTAMGNYSTASGDFSTAMGNYTTASGNYSTAMGDSTVAGGRDSTAMGIGSAATGTAATAMGDYSVAGGDHAVAMGQGSQANGINSFASGEGCLASDLATTAMGYHSMATNSGGTAIGVYAVAGENAVALGAYAYANGEYSSALGNYVYANGYQSTAIGYGSIANGITAMAIGDLCVANGNSSTAMGYSSEADHIGTFIWADASSDNVFQSTGNNQFLIRASGGVGINTPDPLGNALCVSGDARVDAQPAAWNEGLAINCPTNMAANGGFGGIHFHSTGPGQGFSSSSIKWSEMYNYAPEIGNGVGGGLAFIRNNSSTTLYLGSSGNVGVGTASPDALLTVNGAADKPGGGSWSTYSDARLKDVKNNFTPGLDALEKIQPVRYHYKADNSLKLPSQPEFIGVVAQQLQQAVPEAVQTNSSGYLTVNNDPVIWTTVNAVKELNRKLETENAELKARLTRLEKLLTQTSK